MTIKFPCLEADEDYVANLMAELQICSLCGKFGRCFLLDTYYKGYFSVLDDIDIKKLNQSSPGSQNPILYGCLECLNSGRFVFIHDTELDIEVNQSDFKKNNGQTENFSQKSIDDLLRTPHYAGVQHEFWMIHCDDFMTYLGTWQPYDFAQNAQDGDGKKLFMQMLVVSDDYWEYDNAMSTFPPVIKPGEWWAFACHTFRCRQCGIIRAFEDRD